MKRSQSGKELIQDEQMRFFKNLKNSVNYKIESIQNSYVITQ